jgi:hypothetical protein
VDHVLGPARRALVAPAARVAAAQARLILAEVEAVDRATDPVTAWCALHGIGAVPPHVVERVAGAVAAARRRAADLQQDVRALAGFCATAGVPPTPRLQEAHGALSFLMDTLESGAGGGGE